MISEMKRKEKNWNANSVLEVREGLVVEMSAKLRSGE